MSQKSDIEWTGATWNCVRGCVKVSPGCKRCYAETFAERWRGIPGHAYEQGFDPRLVPESLDWPLTKRKPLTIFVNSMSDLFGEFVPDEYIAAVFGVMLFARRHTFQVLTKRAERLPVWSDWLIENPKTPFEAMEAHGVEDVLSGFGPFEMRSSPISTAMLMGGLPWPLPNVHLGVSVENLKHGIPRIEHLRRTPAAVRFLSIEPLLEDVADALDLSGIDWVIVGAESGHGARPMNEDWVRRIRDKCASAGVPFFYKQRLDNRGRKVSLPILDGVQHAAMPAARRVA